MVLLVLERSLKSPLHNATIVSTHHERAVRAHWLAISQVRFLYGLPTYSSRTLLE